ncbi:MULTISPECIES: 23S rRNA (guanosine(2251)-2'-O)-methyltransferase RlmB [unclassified Beijerinckia]|uniref:23S rRNA (guanosine(2251)-2'-O)-methyltransferase RlmB n=1 Tax=unclassified Beijerinckia TaxID=2638183 RepID=UPI00089AFBDB|nr:MULTISPECIES: 23S rRNA (guanosine(2251)-2'-O)-methyltransferase RlmB [unclassified Beijerinckia]MDH7794213.1 23S rRNA (guanosine2251-2'-O)-methyltransferase [Beijerinckia sp. GAS462]SEB55944.1 23S rRNA (guanosine2251-2'-O)-methyltransferase [Beijerinckia sp. 28-YEA-48]
MAKNFSGNKGGSKGGEGRRGPNPEGRPPARQGRGHQERGSRSHPPGHRPDPDIVQIFGFHAATEALKAPRRKIVRVYATAAAAQRLEQELSARKLTPIVVEAEEISARLAPDAVHQGILVEGRALEPLDITDLVPEGIVLILDQVTDPHNVGAILRTAAAYGVQALITTERHSPAMTGILAKAASGALEHVPIVSVVNLARAMEYLGREGFLRVGLDSDGPASLEATPLRTPIALALGAEGKGLRRLTRENCDVLARLDMPGAIRSLNVSNACAVALTLIRVSLSR